MKITRFTTRRPVTTCMFFLGVVLLGLVSLRELSVDLLPDIGYPRLSVVTRYPGAAPEEMEILVTDDLEAAVSRIPGLRSVESVSKEGVSYMVLEFSWGTDMDLAMLHTREKLDGVELPDDAEGPTIISLDPQSRSVMVLSVSGAWPLLELKEFTEELIKPRLEQVEGIGSAEIAGGVEREIQIEVNPTHLALYGLTIGEISQKMDAFNRNLQGGTIRKGRFQYSFRVKGEFESLDEIGEVGLKITSARSVVRLKDVARIFDSMKRREGITRLNGKESIGILVRKESGANTVKVTQAARKVLREIQRENPGVEVLIVSEQAEYIENAISSVLNAILLGGILAFLVLFVFLQDVKTPFIIAAVIPISIIATFNLMYIGGITLNIMSLGGMALGVGMLVDNSVVVSESIFRYRNLGKSPLEAAVTGTKEVGMAVTASTLTTISVFFPVIYVHGVAGQLFKDQAMTVTFALLSSLMVSLTLLPMLTCREIKVSTRNSGQEKRISDMKDIPQPALPPVFLFPLKGIRWLLYNIPKGALAGIDIILSFFSQLLLLILHYLYLLFKPIIRIVFQGYNAAFQNFVSGYHQVLVLCLDNKPKVLIGSGAFLVITLGIGTQIPRELMPKPEALAFEIHMKAPVEYSLEQNEAVVTSLEYWLKNQERVNATFSLIGIVSGLEAANPDVSLNSARLYVETGKSADVEDIIAGLRTHLRGFPELSCSIVKEQSALIEFLAVASSEVGLKVKGEDLNQLKALAEQLASKLGTVPGIMDISANFGEGKPEFLILIKKDALEKYDVSPSALSSFIVDAVRGKIATQFKELEKKYDIRIRLHAATRENIESLLEEQMPHRNILIPLRELVACEISRGPKEIHRKNQQREILVTANLYNKKISQVIPAIKEKIEELEVPPGYRVTFSGEQEEMAQSFQSLTLAFSLAVLLVYMILAAQFESLKHPFLILLTLPVGLTGAVWALWITGQTLNVISFIGMVVLAGIVVNDAIVKIDFTNQLRKNGFSVREAILEASRVRLRPIMMTTMTTVSGLFPMSLGLGRGSELQQPLAISVVGGLVLATFLTLILIPVAYEMVEKKKIVS